MEPGPIAQAIRQLRSVAHRLGSSLPLTESARLVLRGAMDELRATYEGQTVPAGISAPVLAAIAHLESAMADVRGAVEKAKQEAVNLGKVPE